MEGKKKSLFAARPSVVGDFILDPLKSTGTVRTIDKMVKLLDYV